MIPAPTLQSMNEKKMMEPLRIVAHYITSEPSEKSTESDLGRPAFNTTCPYVTAAHWKSPTDDDSHKLEDGLGGSRSSSKKRLQYGSHIMTPRKEKMALFPSPVDEIHQIGPNPDAMHMEHSLRMMAGLLEEDKTQSRFMKRRVYSGEPGTESVSNRASYQDRKESLLTKSQTLRRASGSVDKEGARSSVSDEELRRSSVRKYDSGGSAESEAHDSPTHGDAAHVETHPPAQGDAHADAH